jgi:hypothetical protein
MKRPRPNERRQQKWPRPNKMLLKKARKKEPQKALVKKIDHKKAET